MCLSDMKSTRTHFLICLFAFFFFFLHLYGANYRVSGSAFHNIERPFLADNLTSISKY